jgi:hypothetical protein
LDSFSLQACFSFSSSSSSSLGSDAPSSFPSFFSQVYIKDTKSSNGTFVNDERLSPSGVESEARVLQSGVKLGNGKVEALCC